MFSKSALMAIVLALPAVFGSVDEGVYRISSYQSRTTVRTYINKQPLYVSNTLEYPGEFEQFEVRNGEDGSQNVYNLGLEAPVLADPEEEGSPVITYMGNDTPTQWEISPAGKDDVGQDVYTIQVANEDLLWTAEKPIIPRGEIKLRGANGSASQRWYLHRIEDGFENIDGTEAEAAKFGHLLGQVLSQVGHELLN